MYMQTTHTPTIPFSRAMENETINAQVKACNKRITPIGRWWVSSSLLIQLSQCLTHTPSLFKRLTLIRRQTQQSTNEMKAMTPHKPPLTNVTIDDTTDPQTNGATVQPIAAMCVREVYDQSVLQFTINHKVCFALPRYTSRVIHRSKFLDLHTSYLVARHATLSPPTHW